jgi:hypothetical protein
MSQKEKNIMNINVNVQRKFKVDGRVYNSVEDMPHDIQNALKKAMASQATTGIPAVKQTKIIFNGTEYKSIEEMPSDDRQLYEKVLRAAETGNIPPTLVTTGDISVSENESKIFGNTNATNMGTPTKAEAAISPRILIFGITLISIIILTYYMFQIR